MKKISQKLILAVASLAVPVASFAQTQTVDGLLNQTTTTVRSAGTGVANVVSLLIGLVGIIMLGWNFAKRAKGDQQSNDALMNWGSALIIAAIFLQVIKAVYF